MKEIIIIILFHIMKLTIKFQKIKLNMFWIFLNKGGTKRKFKKKLIKFTNLDIKNYLFSDN